MCDFSPGVFSQVLQKGATMEGARARHSGRIFLGELFVLVLAVLALSGCAQDVAPKICAEWDFDCYTEQALGGLKAVRENISSWTRLNLIGQILVLFLSIVATLVIALQDENNKHLTRTASLVITALVTGITSALVTFQVPENIERLADVLGEMTTETNKFMLGAEKLKGGRDKDELRKVYREDPVFRNAAIELNASYVGSYNKLKLDLLKLGGKAVNLRTPQQTPPPPPPAK